MTYFAPRPFALATMAFALTTVMVAPASAQNVRFTAQASFVEATTECVTTEVFVFVSAMRAGRSNRAPTGRMDLKVFATDDCTGEVRLEGRARQQLRNGDLRFDDALNTVELDTTAQMSNAVAERDLSVDVGVSWTGGDTVDASTDLEIDQPGRIRRGNPRVRTLLRFAEAVGSVSSGNQTFASGGADDATMSLRFQGQPPIRPAR